MNIELVPEQIDAIIVSELKQSLLYIEEDERGLKDALKQVLKYFMVHSEYVEEFGDEGIFSNR